jgi:hypothetical protein
VAVALSFLIPGIGQLYLREWLRAIAWFVLASTIPMGLFLTGELPMAASFTATMEAFDDVSMYAQLSLLVVTVLSMIDAYSLAVRHNEAVDRAAGTAAPRCPSCGHDLDDDDLEFCPWCAEALESDAD